MVNHVYWEKMMGDIEAQLDRLSKNQKSEYVLTSVINETFEKSAKCQDMINHPPHYTHASGVECIQIAEHMSFNLGNVLKYCFRHDRKGGKRDLEKARWYLNREIERVYGEG